jgi:mono/diheme cytochrome c family protein
MKKRFLIFGTALLILGAIAFVRMIRYGFSARDKPSKAETIVAGAMRRWAVPAAVRNAKNPVRVDANVLAEGRAHFADHCATCHGNDGKGQSDIGSRLYPPAPDMTLPATQSLSDGEIFSIIENGIRLTGMPAFGGGTDDSRDASWKLVHFIRHLPRITPAELAEMEALNPKSAEEWEQIEREKAFLSSK